jgi:hypothetical protein
VEVALRFVALLALVSVPLYADPVPVQQQQGAAQGFLVVRDTNGAQIGTGNLQQAVHGGRLTSRVVYRFNDGSVDDETTIFTQARVFRVVSDHHIQRGPLFEKPSDVAFDAASGIVTTRDPKSPETKEHEKDIPADVANGITGTILLNLKPHMQPLTLSMIAPTSKGRLITITITSEGEGDFTISGVARKAAIYRIHPKLGGVTGAIAPVIGKDPKDAMVWVIQGSAPALVREICQLSVGGPALSIELAGTHFQPLSSSKP